MNLIQNLKEKYNLSIWLDYLDKEIIEVLPQWVKENKIYGITTNPTIFSNAIKKLDHFQINQDLYHTIEKIMIENVKKACQIMLPIFEKTNKQDGLVSIEVPPYIAYNTQKTIEKALDLFKQIDMPNVMIKIPATNEGIQAIKKLYILNININVTLLFSVEKYKEVITIFKETNTKSISVASFFVSRLDTVVDDLLLKLKKANLINEDYYNKYVGKIAVANSLKAYKLYQESFKDQSNIQRILWASTSTKNPSYDPLKYVKELLTSNSINTLPLHTYHDLLSSDLQIEKYFELTSQNLLKSDELIDDLKYINLDYLLEELLYKGVTAFSDSYNSILDSIIHKLQITKTA